MENENFKLNFLHVCDYASFSEGGKLNILGIFESINTPKIPYVHPQMFVVLNILIKKTSNYKKIVTRFVQSDNKVEIARVEIPMNIKTSSAKGEFRVGSIGQLNGVKFEKYGKYVIQIFVDEHLIGEKEITISNLKIKNQN